MYMFYVLCSTEFMDFLKAFEQLLSNAHLMLKKIGEHGIPKGNRI